MPNSIQATKINLRSTVKERLSVQTSQLSQLFRPKWCGMSPVLKGYSPSFIKNLSRMCRVSDGIPEYKVFRDVIYLPEYSCLYSTNGDRIDYSCLHRGAQYRIETSAPAKIEVKSYTLDKVSQPHLYVGEIRKHFGHFLTEGIARLWITNELKDYPVAFHLRNGDEQERKMFDILTEPTDLVDIERFINFSRPTLLSEVIVPQPSFFNRVSGHKIHRLFPENFAQNTLPQTSERTSQPLYLSRRLLPSDLRKIINEYELEERLKQAGFAICYPEKLDLKEQVRIINKHEMIVGNLGSAFLNLLFDISPSRNVVYLTDQSYFNPNFLLIDAIKSVQSVYLGSLNYDQTSYVEESQASLQNRVIDLEMTVETLKGLGVM